MERMLVKNARRPESIGRRARVSGWIRTRRDSKGGFSFLELNDGSCLASLQVIADGSLENYTSEVTHLTAGCSVTVEGLLKASSGAEQPSELAAERITVHGWADPVHYPLQKKRHSLEKLREWAHLRPRTNTLGAVARVRSAACAAIHDFFQQRDFLYVHSPIITTSDCEGAGELFRVTTLDPERPPLREGKVDVSRDFFGRPAYLTVSGQLEAEILASALGRVYTFGPTFRAENSNTSRHLAEFWMVEPEVAFCDLDANVRLAEEFLLSVCRRLLEQCADDLEFFAKWVDASAVSTLHTVAERSGFERITYSEAIDLLQACGRTFEYPVEWGRDLQSEHERYLTEEYFRGPVVLTGYPASIKPFYMRLSDDGRTVAAMDVLVPRIGEIIGGSQREERLEVLRSRMQGMGLDPQAYDWYLDLRRFGTVPHAGFGLGLERFVQFVTGITNIRDVIPFPRTPGSADF